jgi:hypothetical protein
MLKLMAHGNVCKLAVVAFGATVGTAKKAARRLGRLATLLGTPEKSAMTTPFASEKTHTGTERGRKNEGKYGHSRILSASARKKRRQKHASNDTFG